MVAVVSDAALVVAAAVAHPMTEVAAAAAAAAVPERVGTAYEMTLLVMSRGATAYGGVMPEVCPTWRGAKLQAVMPE